MNEDTLSSGASEDSIRASWQVASDRATEPLQQSHLAAIPDSSSSRLELTSAQFEHITRHIPGGAPNIADAYPLSPLQEGMLFHHLLNGESDSYVLSSLFELNDDAQLDALIRAVDCVVQRHDVLRTAILWEDLQQPIQVVCNQVSVPVQQLVLERERPTLEQLREQMRPGRHILNAAVPPMMRLQVAADPHSKRLYAILRVHHLVCDHQSLRTVVSEVMTVLAGGAQQLPEAVRYRDYVERAIAGAKAEGAQAFFRSKLAGVSAPTAPFCLLDVHADATASEEMSEELSPSLAQQVRACARECSVSAARLFHAAWALVVAQTSGRDDVVFGTVVLESHQRRGRAGRLVGMSVNTLPLRIRLQGATVHELIQQTDRELKELLQFEQTPLIVAQRCSEIQGQLPLFTALLNYRHSRPDGTVVAADPGGIRVLSRGEASTNYPIAVAIDDTGDGFTITTQTDRQITPARISTYLRTALQSLVHAIQNEPTTAALSLSIVPAQERQQLLELSRGPEQRQYPQSSKTVHQLIEEQTERTPAATAVVYAGQSLTYAQLNQRANRLAHYLTVRGAGPDTLIALCTKRSLEMVVGVLGILKAGSAYVPLDPEYPPDRLRQMLLDSAPRAVLIHGELRNLLPPTQVEVIALDEDWEAIEREADTDLDPARIRVRPHHLAYVIYTSGSTGQPKGVLIDHQSAVNLWHGLEAIYRDCAACERVALNASLNFDASVQQLVQLISGRTLFVVPAEIRRDPAMLLDFLLEHQIDAIDCTPSQLRAWIAAGMLEDATPPVRLLLVGGEAIDAQLWQSLAMRADMVCFNVYGPTECTVDCTAAKLSGDTTAPHLGRPMTNRRVYVLGLNGEPVPAGVVGEIFVAGIGVGRGYLNREALTQERFLRDPFTDDPTARMYKSGDLGRLRRGGVLEYLGRNDSQVKIRGFRIELGEIEAQLLDLPGIRQVAVVVREDSPGEQRLVAYVVPADSASAPTSAAMRDHLQAILPSYMVPSAFVSLVRMPLSSSGKLHRDVLPAPTFADSSASDYDSPRDELEETLADIWQELLHVERAGRNDNFFEFGANSFTTIRFVVSVAERLAVKLHVHAVYEHPTLAEMADFIRAQAEDRYQPVGRSGPAIEEGRI